MPSRRNQILSTMNGGTTAPNPRRKQIREALGKAMTPPRGPRGAGGIEPGQRMPQPMRFPQVAPRPQGPRQGAPLRAPINPGAQLKSRVQSGAISGEQAQKTARQRQLLKNAFGSDWRKQIFGAGGARGIKGPFAQRQVAAKRQQGLERAKRKLY